MNTVKDLCDTSGCKVEFRVEQNDFVVVFIESFVTSGTSKMMHINVTWTLMTKLPAKLPIKSSQIVGTDFRVEFFRRTLSVKSNFTDKFTEKEQNTLEIILENPAVSTVEIGKAQCQQNNCSNI